MPFQFPNEMLREPGLAPNVAPYPAEAAQHGAHVSRHSPYFQPPMQASSKVVKGQYLMTQNGPLGTPGQANAAASFFAKAHQRLGLQPQQRVAQPPEDSSEERQQFPTNFKILVQRSPPQIPSILLRPLEETLGQQNSTGKIRVVARVTQPHFGEEVALRHFQVDRKRRQITLYDPSALRGSPEERKIGVAAPKMFAFDGLFTNEDSQEDVCQVALPEVLQAVLNGHDGCVFCFGHANLGKTRSMLGSDQCARDMGVIPIAIAWLYRAIKERKVRQGARFSVRVSCMEITGQREDVRDLLKPYETENDQSPAVYLNQLPVQGRCLQNQSELRAPTAEKAAHLLDAALAGRSLDAQGKESHLIYTLHVYQYSVNPNGSSGGVHGGRSRLHLIDFGGCERTRGPGKGITLSGLGNVLLGIFNGQKHLPHRDSKVTQILKECLGSLTCQATMLAHVSPEACHYSETLHTVQLASRLHRMRRRRMKASSQSGHSGRARSAGASGGRRSGSDLTTSGTSTNYSSSEMSCDTVVYRGQSDGSGTDSEHPPIFLPASLKMLNGLGGNSSAPGSLHGSYDDIPRPHSANRRRRKILTNGAISPRRNLSPQPSMLGLGQQGNSHFGFYPPQQHNSPNRSLSSLPVIHEVNTNSRKMPLNGLVPVPGRRRHQNAHVEEQWVDGCVRNSTPRGSNNNMGSPLDTSKEIWIDACPQQQQQLSNNNPPLPEVLPKADSSPSLSKRTYGFMDEHKQNMISSWVQTQTCEQGSSFQPLTQFKEESDEDKKGEQHQVLVHAADPAPAPTVAAVAPAKKCPPPPPPRRTPPREGLGLANANLANNNNPPHDYPARAQDSLNGNVEDHPLRILSEENLTVVSSFAGSLNELPNDDEEESNPPQLPPFEVPDFGSLKESMEQQENFIKQRFQQFAQLDKNLSPMLPKKHEEKPADESPEASQPQEKPQLLPQQSKILTPQKQFQLLAASLRHPDGSSNPEINVEQQQQPPQRSPGNGKSQSDLDEEAVEVAPVEEKAKVPQIEAVQAKKPESSGSRFGFRFLRIFGSTRKLNKNAAKESSQEGSSRRSKSCDSRAPSNNQGAKSNANATSGNPASKLFRSAGSSPSLKTTSSGNGKKSKKAAPKPPNLDPNNTLGTPSVLSLATTEWEFQKEENAQGGGEEDEDEGTSFDGPFIAPGAGFLLQPGMQIAMPKLGKVDRKSSGYDSLGGDESSSLDSNEELQRRLQQQQLRQQCGVVPEVPYSVPSDSKELQLIQYDEVDILRMEQRLKHVIYH